MNNRRIVGWLATWLLLTALYAGWLRGLVVAAFDDTAPGWFMAVVNGLYPRFAVEKHRFELSFFLRHADQIVIRFGLVNLALVAFFIAKHKLPAFNRWWYRFWAVRESTTRIRVYTGAIYACVLFFSYDWYWALARLYQARDFYRPLLLLRWLHVPFPPLVVIAVLCSVLVISSLLVIFRFQELLFTVLVAAVFTVLQAWIYSFEKLDHAFAPLTYVLWLMPWLLHQTQYGQPQWALSLIRVVIATVYLQAGLEKLLIGGSEWLAPETFRNYLYLHPTATGLWVARYEWLCVLLPLLGLLFQLGFISIIFYPKLRRVLLPAGILFHTGTYVLMDVGGLVNAWVWLYVLFL